MQNTVQKKKGLHFVAIIFLDILLAFSLFFEAHAGDTPPEPEDTHPVRAFFSRLFSGETQAINNETTMLSSSIAEKARILANKADGIDEDVLELALKAHACAVQKKHIKNDDILTVIDYSQPSTEERLWVFDLNKNKQLFNTLVAHGKNSGEKYSTRFSDHPGSAQSSLGGFTTGRTYIGAHGRSLELIGHEPGFNAHALSRRIVIHGADYATDAFASARGFLGRSFGCPAISGSLVQPIISKIQNGSFVFAYYPDKTWLKKSKYLHCEA